MAEPMDVKGLSDLINAAKTLNQNMSLLVTAINNVFPIAGAVSATASIGSNGAPPAQVSGYMTVVLPNGSSVKIPYYNP